jgi:hypothetical protein
VGVSPGFAQSGALLSYSPRTLGLTLPPALLLRADHVIE